MLRVFDSWGCVPIWDAHFCDEILGKTISACEFRESTLASRDAIRFLSFFWKKKGKNLCNCANAVNWVDDCEKTRSEWKVRRMKEHVQGSLSNEWIRLHSRWFALHLICITINWPQLPKNLWRRGCSCHHNPRRGTPFSVSSSIADEKLLALLWYSSAACNLFNRLRSGEITSFSYSLHGRNFLAF